MSIHRLCVLVAGLCLTTSIGLAQIKSSTITGVVTDSSAAVVPGATVTVKNQDTNVSTELKTSSTGDYTVPYLPAGRYSVTVEAKGFQVYRATGVVMGTETTVRVDARLLPGSVSSSVNVVASAVALQSESPTVQSAVDQNVIANVPNINGDPLYYASLQAGVIPAYQMYGASVLGVGSTDRQQMSALRINGGELGSGDVLLDGVSVQGAGWHEATVLPDRDALQEVRVTTNTFSADTGNAQGVISMTTKSGTNRFHGTLNYNLRNEDLNANGLYNNQNGVPRGKYRVNQGGGTIGGPVIIPKLLNGKDKLFFFASFSRLTHSDPVVYLAKVPTALERQGNFSQTMFSGTSGVATPVQIFDPGTSVPYQGSTTVFQRQPYPNAIVTNPDPYGMKILQSYPSPNHTPSDAFNTNNYEFLGSTPTLRNNLSTRLDYRLGTKHSIYLTGGLENGSRTPQNRWGSNSFTNLAFPALVADNNPYASVGDTILVSNTMIVDVRYGVTRVNTNASFPTGTSFDYSAYGLPAAVQSLIAVQGAAPTIGNFAGTGNAAGYASLNADTWDRKKERQFNHTLTGSVTKVHGSWTFKSGAEYRVYLSNWQDLLYGTPSLGLSGGTNLGNEQMVDAYGNPQTSLEPLPQEKGFDAATALTGATGFFLTPGADVIPALSSKVAAFYTQNDWKATSKLTINLGLRYELQPAPTERYNHIASLSLNLANPYAAASNATYANPSAAMGAIVFPGVGGDSRHLWATELDNLDPRIGAAYRITRSTVLRGGYGRTYTPSNSGFNANALIYGTTAYSGGASANPYGVAGNNGVPIGRFENPQNTLIVAPAGPGQSPTLYGNTNSSMGVDWLLQNGYKNGAVDQWNFFVQRTLGHWSLDAGYLGSRGSNLPWRNFQLTGTWAVPDSVLQSWRSIWLASKGVTNPASVLVPNPIPALVGKAGGSIGQATITALNAQQPYLALLGQTILASNGNSEYNALQVHASRSYADGLQINLHYTWSKALGVNGGLGSSSYAESQMGGSQPSSGGIDYRNLNNDRSLLGFDNPNRFVGIVTYLLPTGKGQRLDPGNRFVRGLVGGWQLGTVVTLQSGEPWGPSCGGTLNGRCNVVPGEPVYVPKALQHWYNGKTTATLPDGRVITPAVNTYLLFNPDQFTAPVVQYPSGGWTADEYQWGTTSRTLGYLRLPGFANVNLTVNRKFPIREGMNLELVAEATNLLNRTNFIPSDMSVGAGAVTAAVASTNTKIGQNSSVSTGSLSMSFMDPRQVSLSLRLRF